MAKFEESEIRNMGISITRNHEIYTEEVGDKSVEKSRTTLMITAVGDTYTAKGQRVRSLSPEIIRPDDLTEGERKKIDDALAVIEKYLKKAAEID